MKSNPPLKRPPLQEAIFEIRFPPMDDYAIFAGGMAVSHEEDFPVVEKLQTVDIPEFIQVSGVVKHRFYAATRGKLFQTGSDVIAVNVVKYEGFSSFVNDIKEVINSAYKFSTNVKRPTRISLRYINNFQKINDPFEVLSINQPFGEVDFTKKRFIQIRDISQVDDEVLLAVNCQSVLSEKNLILDLEAFYENIDSDWDTEIFVQWAWKAHDIIWDSLNKLVSKTEMEDRK